MGSSDRPAELTCEVCGGHDQMHLYTLTFQGHPGPFGLWACRGCGLVFNWPRQSAEGVHDQYDGDYYFFKQPPARRWSRTAQLYIEQLLPLERSGARTLLDIGCGRGDLLALARARGWQTAGLELSGHAVCQARLEHGLDIEMGTLDQRARDLGHFDVVICTDVIEHVLSPRQFVRKLHGITSPGGCAIVETPNWGSAWRRLGGERWIGLNRFHLFFFNPHNLPRLMRACGFRWCCARTSTNTAHAQWGTRPELLPILATLPSGLRWRAQAAMNWLTPPSLPVELRRDPPASLNDALRRVARSPATSSSHRPPGVAPTWHDNLAVIGRA